jgi:hypothetical protein
MAHVNVRKAVSLIIALAPLHEFEELIGTMSNKKTKTLLEQSRPVPFDVEKVREAIGTTGFNLEFQVSEQFRKAGWGVINNKYYVDDLFVRSTLSHIGLKRWAG